MSQCQKEKKHTNKEKAKLLITRVIVKRKYNIQKAFQLTIICDGFA